MQHRYAKLDSNWLLRGWSDMPLAMVNWKTGQLRQLGKDTFYVAKSCDGQTDFGSLAFLPGHIKLLEKFINEGIVRECTDKESLEKVQEYRQAKNPMINEINWAITSHCNMNCRYCFMESPSGRYGHLNLETIKLLIKQFERANVLQVSLTGGEPLLRDDLLEIIKELTAKRIRIVDIATNGTLITASLLDSIKRLGQTPEFRISFDGTGVHDIMRGSQGTEARVIESIQNVMAAGLTVTVTTTLDRDNLSAQLKTYKLIKNLGVPVWLLGRPQTTGNWCGGTTALSTEEMAETCQDLLQQWLADGRPFCILLERFFCGSPIIQSESKHGLHEPKHGLHESKHGLHESFSSDSYECQSVREKSYLLPDGRLLPCAGYTGTSLHDKMPNLLEFELSEIWSASTLRSLVDMKKSEVLANNSECATCEMFSDCGAGCRAYALTEAGSLMAKDPVACAVWKRGYRQLFNGIAKARTENVLNNQGAGVLHAADRTSKTLQRR